MDGTTKKAGIVQKLLIWFLVLSTIFMIYLTVKLFIAGQSFR